jgi:hypothetical protein
MRRLPVVALGTLLAFGAGSARAAFDPDEDRPARIATESGFGIIGGTVGVFGGALIGYGVCALTGEDDRSFGCLLPAFAGGLVGEFVGIGLGVYGGGAIFDGNGGLGWTYLGEAGAALAATAIILGAEVDVGDVSWWLLTTLLPLSGAVLGYELSTTREGPRTVGASFGFAW